MRYLLIVVMFLFGNAFAADAPKPFTQQQESRVKALIRETLVANPDILQQAAQALEQEQNAQIIQLHSDELYNDANSPRIGAKNPKLIMVVFTDYNCPYCKRFDPLLEKIVKQYPEDVAVIFKLLPFKGESSVKAAQLVLTTWRTHPKQFLPLHQALMAKLSSHTDASISKIQQDNALGDVKPDEQSKLTIRQNLQLAGQLGVQGTPATLVGNQMVAGALSYEDLHAIVRQQLPKKS